MVNNSDWLLKLNYVEFLRDVGVHFSVNRMLAAECFKSRMEKGLTFLEFNYMLMQSYDFLVLNDKYDCRLELGGDDQWSNIIGGVELVRKARGKSVYGMTFTLLTTSEGKKMGKTEKGAIWLSADKTPPFEFYQYWRNVDDKDVIKCIKMLTFIPLDDIAEMEKWEGSELNKAKRILAYELTKMVHGENEAKKAQEAAMALFDKGRSSENMPTSKIQSIEESKNLIELLLEIGFIPSKGEGRRLIKQGGLYINNNRITDINYTINLTDFINNEMIIRKGKKTYHRVISK
jgi:tyrosyl-tRNA synthetase